MEFLDSTSTRNISTGTAGIAGGISFMAGCCYAVSVERADLADKLIWTLLAGACEADNAACLVTPGSVRESHQHSGVCAHGNALLANPLLTLLEMDRASARKDISRLSRNIMDDLQHFGRKKQAMLIIDCAETMLPATCRPALADWRSWAESQGTAVLFVFRRCETKKSICASLESGMHLLSGVSSIHCLAGKPVWEVAHWFGADGLQTRTCYPLDLDREGRISARGRQMMVVAPQDHASDETKVFVQRAAVRARETIAQDWQLLDDGEQVLHPLRGAIGATLILAFSKRTCFADLLRTVYAVRQQCGSHLKILIREVGACLRSGEEASALRLGANLVVPSEVGYERLRRLVASMHGQVFSFSLPCTFEQVGGSAAVVERGGYLGVPEFVAAIRKTLDCDNALHSEAVLMRLAMAKGLTPLDGLACFGRMRPGDLVTCDDRSIYLLLQACRSIDAGTALDRLYPAPGGGVIRSEAIFATTRAIADAAADLDYRHRIEQFPDLSNDYALRCLQSDHEERASRPDAKTPETSSFSAPKPALPHRLLMKGPPPLAVIAGLPS